MFDAQTPGVALLAVCAVGLFVILPSVVIEAHTGRSVSRWLHVADRRSSRSALFVEVPLIVWLVGGSQLVMAAVVISPSSGLVTRVIGAIELVAFLAWMTYLIRSIRKDGSR